MPHLQDKLQVSANTSLDTTESYYQRFLNRKTVLSEFCYSAKLHDLPPLPSCLYCLVLGQWFVV